MQKLKIAAFLIANVFHLQAWAAACCGGGFSAPALITGDDRAQFSASYSFTQIAIDSVDGNGIWHVWDQHQQVQTLRLDAAKLISDRWQIGMSIPVIQRESLQQTYSGLGDVAGSLGYEYLPDWDYNPWRPRGLGFLQLTLPTGKSKAESENGGLDSRGNGFFALGIGTVLSKSIDTWDVFSTIEAHHSFGKSVNNTQLTGTLNPGNGSNFGAGIGYNTKSWRYGSSLIWTYEDPVQISGSENQPGSIERYATGSLSVAYMASDDWSSVVTYADQTLFGAPVNTSLGRTLSLQLLRKWGR